MAAGWTRSIVSLGRRLVLACGNTLRGDDGVGWRIAEAVEEDSSLSGVQVIISHQWAPELAEPISGADTVIFVDCSAVSLPGEISVFPVSPQKEQAATLTHNVSPASLLALAKEIFGAAPGRAWALTIGGMSFELSEALSEPVEAVLAEAIQRLKELLVDESANS